MFPKFDAKKCHVKKVAWKLHDTLMMQYFPVQVLSSEQHFGPRHSFLSQYDYLGKEKEMVFHDYCIYLNKFWWDIKKCQKMPKRAWHFCFFQKMPWGLKKCQICIFGTKNAKLATMKEDTSHLTLHSSLWHACAASCPRPPSPRRRDVSREDTGVVFWLQPTWRSRRKLFPSQSADP